MKGLTGKPGSSIGRIPALAAETFRETRGAAPFLLVLSGGALLSLIGLRLPKPLEEEGSLAVAFLFGGITLVLGLLGIAWGAWSLAADRSTGFRNVLLSKPLSGAAYFIGRFLGLAARLTIMAFAVLAFGGLVFQVLAPELKFSRIHTADRLDLDGEQAPMDTPHLLAASGPEACWTFTAAGSGGTVDSGLRFTFRPRYPRGEPFTSALSMRITVVQGDAALLDETYRIIHRKSLVVPFRATGGEEIRVTARIATGHNFLEISKEGCVLVTGNRGALGALLAALTAFLPKLYLGLAVALLFSTFVSVPPAFFATAVLGLMVVMGPALRTELIFHGSSAPSAAHSHVPNVGVLHAPPPAKRSPGLLRSAARLAASALALLPDPAKGGGLDPLTRMEAPSRAAVIGPWEEGLPHLLIASIFGCRLAGRRLD